MTKQSECGSPGREVAWARVCIFCWRASKGFSLGVSMQVGGRVTGCQAQRSWESSRHWDTLRKRNSSHLDHHLPHYLPPLAQGILQGERTCSRSRDPSLSLKETCYPRESPFTHHSTFPTPAPHHQPHPLSLFIHKGGGSQTRYWSLRRVHLRRRWLVRVGIEWLNATHHRRMTSYTQRR